MKPTKHDAVVRYTRQAAALGFSLKKAGKTLRIFTNDQERLSTVFGECFYGVECPFSMTTLEVSHEIPGNIPFFAAHHKIYTFSTFAAEEGYNCLLDLDMVCTATADALREELGKAENLDGWVYGISDQVFPAYGRNTVQHTLAALNVLKPFPNWYGGEFLLGNKKFFSVIDRACHEVIPRYLEIHEQLFHNSDEAIVSAAINNSWEYLRIGDAGHAGILTRFWTCRTPFVQRRTAVLRQTAFWHLPDLKHQLEEFSSHQSVNKLYRQIQIRAALGLIKGYFKPKRRVISKPVPPPKAYGISNPSVAAASEQA